MVTMDQKEWSDISYTLDEVLKEFSPPLTVLVDEGYMLDENESLAAGQVITIQSQETMMQFKGYDTENKKVCIPVNFPFKVKVVSQLEGRLFNNIGEITNAKPSAKFVKLLTKGQKELASVTKGDRLKILLTERDKQGPTFLHLRNQNGKHLRLSVGFNGKFCECGESDEEYLLKDLVYRKLPFCIKFVVNNEKSKIGDLVGVIKITEVVNETLTFCTAYSSGKRFMAAFPVTFDVKVRPVKTSSVDNEDSNKLTIENKRFEKLRQSIYIENLVDDGNQVRFLSLEETDNKHDSPLSPTQESSTGREEDLPSKNSNEFMAKKDGELSINRNDPKRKSTGFLSKVKSKLRGTKSNGNKPKQKRPEIVVLRDSNGACSDGGDSGIYEEIHGDIYVSMDVIDGIHRTLGRTSSVEKPSVPIADIPPPLPANHPIERRHTVCMKNSSRTKSDKNIEQEVQRDKENFRKFYECMRKSEQELKSFDMEDVAEILKKLKLGKHVRRFQENKIDGKLLVDLDEAVFRDMELTPFESRKLRKYVFGWRPDNDSITNSKYSESKDNLNAMLWSENEVEAHMNSLGMKEFATFCKDNQVNGNLLWDIVVDEDMVFGLLNGKDRKLNSIKLKNYVIEGWRPKTSKKQSHIDGGITKVRSKSFNSGRKLSMGFEKNKTAKITSNYESTVGKSRITTSTQVTKDILKESDRGTIKTRKIASASSTTTTNQRASSLYERPVSAPSTKHVLSSKANGAANRNGNSKQASNEYEVPVTRTASCRRVNTLSRQRSTGDTNAYEEPVKKTSSSSSKTVGKRKGSFGEQSCNEAPGRNVTLTTQPSFASKRAVSKPALLSQSIKVPKPGTTPSKAEVTKKNGSRSVTPTSSTSSKGESPRVIDFNAETRPKSKSQAKVTYPHDSPYGKRGGNTTEVENGNNKKDAKQESKLKMGENGKRMPMFHNERKQTPRNTVRPSGAKESEGKSWQKKVTGSENKTDKGKGTDQIKQGDSCKNTQSKVTSVSSQTKPQQAHLSNPKEVTKLEKQKGHDADKQSDAFRTKREGNTREPAVSSKIKGATNKPRAEKSKIIEKQRQINGIKEVTYKPMAEKSKIIEKQRQIHGIKEVANKPMAEKSKIIEKQRQIHGIKEVANKPMADTPKIIEKQREIQGVKEVSNTPMGEKSKIMEKQREIQGIKEVTNKPMGEKSKIMEKQREIQGIKEVTNKPMGEKSKIIEKQREIQGIKEVKSSFVSSVIEKYDQTKIKTQIVKTDLKISAKGTSRTKKDNDDETKLLEEDTGKVRKSVAQLKKQFDRT